MTASKPKSKLQLFLFGFITLLMLGGVGLTMAGLLLPNWVLVSWTEQIIVVNAKIGLWNDELCDYQGCKTHWTNDDDYESHPAATFNSRGVVRGLETAGVALAGSGIFNLIGLWRGQQGSSCSKVMAQVYFFAQTIIAAFLCVSGVIVVAAKVENEGDLDYAPILTGIGSALLFIAAVLSCAYNRVSDTARGDKKQANPASKAYVVSQGEMGTNPNQQEPISIRL